METASYWSVSKRVMNLLTLQENHSNTIFFHHSPTYNTKTKDSFQKHLAFSFADDNVVLLAFPDRSHYWLLWFIQDTHTHSRNVIRGVINLFGGGGASTCLMEWVIWVTVSKVCPSEDISSNDSRDVIRNALRGSKQIIHSFIGHTTPKSPLQIVTVNLFHKDRPLIILNRVEARMVRVQIGLQSIVSFAVRVLQNEVKYVQDWLDKMKVGFLLVFPCDIVRKVAIS